MPLIDFFNVLAHDGENSDTPQNAGAPDNISNTFSDFINSNGNIIIFSINSTNGNETSISEVLPGDTLVVQLPNNKIGIVIDDCSKSRLYDWTKITEVNKTYFIDIPDDNLRIATPYKPINFTKSVNRFFLNTSYNQRIDKLDEYQINIIFENTLSTLIVDKAISNYRIDWGDKNIISIDSQLTKTTHIYKSSGKYIVTLIITDCFGNTYNVSRILNVKYEGDLKHFFLVVDRYKEPIAATSFGIGIAIVAAIVLTETGKFKFFTLLTLLIPMFTRIQKEDILDHFVRGQIYGFIKTNPGVCYNEIMRNLDLKNGTLSYHLHMLEKMEMIKSRREGLRYRVFYPTGMKFPEEERYRLNELQLDILKIIRENEGISQNEIANKLNKKPQTINYNIKTLQQAGLIKVRKKGRKTLCYILKDPSNNQNKAC